jgi:hypothetical protein
LPTGRSMNGGFRYARKSRKVNSRNSMRNRKFGGAPERGTVRGLTMSGRHRNTGGSQNFQDTRSSTQAEETREARHPEAGEPGESKTDARSETGTDIRCEGSKTQSREPEVAAANAVKARSRKDQSRGAEDPEEPQVELEGEC